MATFNDVLQDIDKLTIEEQEYIVNIVKKRIIENKRNYLFKRLKEAEESYNQNEVFGGTVEELMDFLNDDED